MEENDLSLEKVLSPESCTKLASVTASIEQALDMV